MMRLKSNCPEVSEKSNLSAGIAGKWHKKRQGTGHITSSHHHIISSSRCHTEAIIVAWHLLPILAHERPCNAEDGPHRHLNLTEKQDGEDK